MNRGDTVIIHRQNPPCPPCQGKMEKAAQKMGVTFAYKNSGKGWSWSG
ncbi:hypothetical protein ABZY30_24780 [Streptomyces massasporeus]